MNETFIPTNSGNQRLLNNKKTQGFYMNELQVFNNDELGQVRTVLQGKDVWFVAKDVADVLEY